MQNNTPNLLLCLYLNDSYNYQYEIKMHFSESLVITAINHSIFPKKNYIGSFSLLDLKNYYKFFKMFESIPEAYNDLLSLSKQNSFFIYNQGNIISLCIRKQIGIQNNIVFPLKEKKSDIKEIVTQLCERNLNLEERVKQLETRVNNLEDKMYKANNKISYFEFSNGKTDNYFI